MNEARLAGSGDLPLNPKPFPVSEIAQSGLVLVVDDDAIVVRTATAALARAGYQVMVAENGAAGLEAFLGAVDCVDLVLADVMMPFLNGLEMAERIKAVRPDARIVLMYWTKLSGTPEEPLNFDLAKEGVLQRITAPTLVITSDRSKLNSVEKARAYQVQIPNSRLVVIRSDAYHIAAANADECVTHTLAFLKEQKI